MPYRIIMSQHLHRVPAKKSAVWIAAATASIAISFLIGRNVRTWLFPLSAPDQRTRLLPRESLPEGRRAYPTGRAERDRILRLPERVHADQAWRQVLDRVGPACVLVGSGSGVCINTLGDILTNAHVALHLGRDIYVQFQDGSRIVARCFAINHRLDLALLGTRSQHTFTSAPLAASAPPDRGQTQVLCVGNPAESHPDGRPSPYERFHVSVGSIIRHDPDPLGDQSLGRTQHDAWTYWGHSGAPLFDRQGRIVAIHNSWDAHNGTRHAVHLDAVLLFLRETGVYYRKE